MTSEKTLSLVTCEAVLSPRVMKTRDAAVYICRSVNYLKQARRGDVLIEGPAFLTVGTRIYYRVKDLDRWLDQFPAMTRLPQHELIDRTPERPAVS